LVCTNGTIFMGSVNEIRLGRLVFQSSLSFADPSIIQEPWRRNTY
jgi:hypothetical protein